MIKNRRKSNYTPNFNTFHDLIISSGSQQNFITQNQNLDPQNYLFLNEKKNEAQLALLGMENQEPQFLTTPFQINRLSLNNTLQTNKKIPPQQNVHRKSQTKHNSYHKNQKVLSQIDHNTNFYFNFNNFLQNTKAKPSNQKLRISMKSIKSKQNFSQTASNSIEKNKHQEKTISKLKNILKKLQSPQKDRNSSEYSQFQVIEEIINKNKINKIYKYGQEQHNYSKSKIKNLKEEQFTNESRLLGRKKIKKPSDFQNDSPFIQESSTSKIRIHSPIQVQTQTKFFSKSKKLTNESMIFKRNSGNNTNNMVKRNSDNKAEDLVKIKQGYNANNLVKRNCYTQGLKKSRRQVSWYQGYGFQNEKNMFEDVFLHQQKLKHQRRNRNLRNILFE